MNALSKWRYVNCFTNRPACRRLIFNKIQEHRRELAKKFRCSPIPTATLPAISQLSVFIAGTLFCRHIAEPPSPLEDERFFTLNSLTSVDPTGVLPIILGLITLSTIETSKWFSKGLLTNISEVKKWSTSSIIKVSLSNSMQTTLRLLSVIRIILGTLVDGVCNFDFMIFFYNG